MLSSGGREENAKLYRTERYKEGILADANLRIQMQQVWTHIRGFSAYWRRWIRSGMSDMRGAKTGENLFNDSGFFQEQF
jgi:hypothetical protein